MGDKRSGCYNHLSQLIKGLDRTASRDNFEIRANVRVLPLISLTCGAVLSINLKELWTVKGLSLYKEEVWAKWCESQKTPSTLWRAQCTETK